MRQAFEQKLRFLKLHTKEGRQEEMKKILKKNKK